MSAPNGSTFDNLKKFGSALGILALPVAVAAGAYYFFQNPNEESGHRHRSPPRSQTPPRRRPVRRWSRSRSPSPERRDLRAILPTHEAPEAQPSVSTSESGNRGTDACPICKFDMSCNPTISLKCGHGFHDECYTVWRYAVVKHNPLANLCPSCENISGSS